MKDALDVIKFLRMEDSVKWNLQKKLNLLLLPN